MIPEITITCAGKRYFINSVTVEQYKRYVDFMQKNHSRKTSDAAFFSKRILQEIFGNQMSLEELGEMDAEEFLAASKEIHFIMQDIIPRKFMELASDSPVEREKSAFDEYDRENGYEDEEPEEDEWQRCRENVDRIIKISIRILNNSYSQCMSEDIVALIDYIKFELETINEN
nr:MAG: hypothetical protein [Bacteriophage sp.]